MCGENVLLCVSRSVLIERMCSGRLLEAFQAKYSEED